MLRKNKFKIIFTLTIFSITYDLTKVYSQNLSFSIIYSLFTALILGSLIGFIFDYKSNKRRELRELNKNITELRKDNINTYNNSDIITKLERLNNLKKENSITEDEYLKLKEQLFKNFQKR